MRAVSASALMVMCMPLLSAPLLRVHLLSAPARRVTVLRPSPPPQRTPTIPQDITSSEPTIMPFITRHVPKTTPIITRRAVTITPYISGPTISTQISRRIPIIMPYIGYSLSMATPHIARRVPITPRLVRRMQNATPEIALSKLTVIPNITRKMQTVMPHIVSYVPIITHYIARGMPIITPQIARRVPIITPRIARRVPNATNDIVRNGSIIIPHIARKIPTIISSITHRVPFITPRKIRYVPIITSRIARHKPNAKSDIPLSKSNLIPQIVRKMQTKHPIAHRMPIITPRTGRRVANHIGRRVQSITPYRNPLRIYRGVDDTSGKYPYVVALLGKKMLRTCTGTLIAPTWVLTAAHCDHEVYIQYGDMTVPKDEIVTTKRILQIIQHPNYKDYSYFSWGYTYNDIAMAQVESVHLGTYGVLSVVDYHTMIGYEVQYAGLGITGFKTNKTLDFVKPLMLGSGVIAPCNGLRSRNFPELCVSHKCYKRQSAMRGDSGGPLFLEGKVIGVNAALNFRPVTTICTPVSPYISWIQQVMVNNNKPNVHNDAHNQSPSTYFTSQITN